MQTVDVTERVLALDIGGTKIAAAWVLPGGEIEDRVEVATPTAGADQLWSVVQDLLESRLNGDFPVAVGIGCGGPLRLDSGEVSPVNIPAWRDFPLLSRVRAMLPAADVRLHNDAVVMAAGEAWFGAGRGADSVLGVVVSTGVGGGLIRCGRIVDGATGNAGHIGHVVVDVEGPVCGCGGIGCLEAIARGPAVVQHAIDLGWRPEGKPDGRVLVAAACAGEPHAAAAIARAGRALGVALASATSLLELDLVAIGGGFAIGAGDLLFRPLREAFHHHARMEYAARCQIVPAALGSNAGLAGAVVLLDREKAMR